MSRSLMRHTHCSQFAVASALVASLLTVGSPRQLVAQAGAPIIGRWDLTVQAPDRTYPSWVEVYLSGHKTLVGKFVAGGGSARPISKVTFSNGRVQFALPPQWEVEPNDVQVDATLANDKLTGTITQPNGEKHAFTGVRAPTMRRSAPPVWGKEVVLFGGSNMSAWEPLPGGESQWQVLNGLLTNTKSGANLATKQKFTDFKLHVEFRVPKGGNSGIYLRGRHEVQVEDSPLGEPLSTHLGGVYGFLVPNEQAHKGPNVWQTFDITLIGRRVTVVLNGKTVIADQTIPGITGGALDANEGEPGVIYLQGDHTSVEYRNIRITPVVGTPR
ncbi:3-keto-disaccharide hydrolase [Gemmatimonas sp.]